MEGVAPVCPQIEIRLKIVQQTQQTHNKRPIVMHDRDFIVRGMVQGTTNQASLSPASPVTVNSGRQYRLYIVNDSLELLSYLQAVPYHIVAYFAFGSRDVTAQVMGFEDCRHNRWLRLDCSECKPQPINQAGHYINVIA